MPPHKRKLDVQGILNIFGPPALVAKALETEKLAKIQPIAVYRWLSRGLIPSEHLVALMILARRNKVKFDPVEFWKS